MTSESDETLVHQSWSSLAADTDPTQTLIAGGSTPTSLAEVTRESERDTAARAAASGDLESGVELTARIRAARDGSWWEGRQRIFDRPVLIQELDAGADAQRQRAFLRSAQIAGGLQHPRTVPVHDHDGRHLIMQQVAGVSLRQWRSDHGDDPADVIRAVDLLLAAIEVLPLAHEAGIIHRDIKADRILVADFGAIYLVDWSLAIAVAELSEQTMTAGTPSHLAPEVARGQIDHLGTAIDVWSVAATVYELLTGQGPFAAANTADSLVRAAAGAVPRPDDPTGLFAVIAPYLAPDPSLRGDITALISDLRRWQRRQGRLQASLAARAEAERLAERARRDQGMHADWAAAVLQARRAFGLAREARAGVDDAAVLLEALATEYVDAALATGDLGLAGALVRQHGLSATVGHRLAAARRRRQLVGRALRGLVVVCVLGLAAMTLTGVAWLSWQAQERLDWRQERESGALTLLQVEQSAAAAEEAAGLAPWSPTVQLALADRSADLAAELIKGDRLVDARTVLHRAWGICGDAGRLGTTADALHQAEQAMAEAAHERQQLIASWVDDIDVIGVDQDRQLAIDVQLRQWWEQGGGARVDATSLVDDGPSALRQLAVRSLSHQLEADHVLSVAQEEGRVGEEATLQLLKRWPQDRIWEFEEHMYRHHAGLFRGRRLDSAGWRSRVVRKLDGELKRIGEGHVDQDVLFDRCVAYRYRPMHSALLGRFNSVMVSQFSYKRAKALIEKYQSLPREKQAEWLNVCNRHEDLSAADHLVVGKIALDDGRYEIAAEVFDGLALLDDEVGAVARYLRMLVASKIDDWAVFNQHADKVWADWSDGTWSDAVFLFHAVHGLSDRRHTLHTPVERMIVVAREFNREDLGHGVGLLHWLGDRSTMKGTRIAVAGLQGTKHYREARRIGLMGLLRHPNAHFLYSELALISAYRGDYDASRGFMDATLSILPRHSGMLLRHTHALGQAGEWRQATSRALKANQLFPRRPGILYELCQVAFAAGCTADALRAARGMTKHSVSRVSGAINLVRLLGHSGQMHLMLDVLEEGELADGRARRYAIEEMAFWIRDIRRRKELWPGGSLGSALVYEASRAWGSQNAVGQVVARALLAELALFDGELTPVQRSMTGALNFLADDLPFDAIPSLMHVLKNQDVLYRRFRRMARAWLPRVRDGTSWPLERIHGAMICGALDPAMAPEDLLRLRRLWAEVFPDREPLPEDLTAPTPTQRLSWKELLKSLPSADPNWDWPPREYRAWQEERKRWEAEP